MEPARNRTKNVQRFSNGWHHNSMNGIPWIDPQKRRRLREPPRTPARRKTTRSQSPWRHFRTCAASKRALAMRQRYDPGSRGIGHSPLIKMMFRFFMTAPLAEGFSIDHGHQSLPPLAIKRGTSPLAITRTDKNDATRTRLVQELRTNRMFSMTGAGLSCWAGYPAWTPFLDRLAARVHEYDEAVDIALVQRQFAGRPLQLAESSATISLRNLSRSSSHSSALLVGQVSMTFFIALLPYHCSTTYRSTSTLHSNGLILKAHTPAIH